MKKRTSDAISETPAEHIAEDAALNAAINGSDAAKKAKTGEFSSGETHKTHEMPPEEEGDAMDMDMGDDDEEQFVAKDDLEGMSPEELAQLEEDRKMMEAMGIPTSFGTTKGRHVEGNSVYAANKIKQRKARQVIHKKGRPKAGGRQHAPKQ